MRYLECSATRWQPVKEFMKLEVGKFYRIRSGEKFKCVHLFKHNYFVFINETTSFTTNSNGGFDGCGLTSHDIISEWEEPKPKRQAFIDENGFVRFNQNGILHFTGKAPKLTPAPWLDEPEGE